MVGLVGKGLFRPLSHLNSPLPSMQSATNCSLRRCERRAWDGLHERSMAARATTGQDASTHSRSAAGSSSSSMHEEEVLSRLSVRQPQAGPGAVYLVGTGPGDPGLLTLRAAQLMNSADVVLYDRLVSPDVLRLVHGGAMMVYVGKEVGYHTRTQDEIHILLCRFAHAGATVLRLKGGDPYIFGRGGEEAQYLRECGINVHCVPGITAASGISAELGIPLTHRGLATSVRFLTGHARESGEAALDATVAASADPATTLVIYMGLGTLPSLVAQLCGAGLPCSTPAVAVERGTTPQQRIVFACLEDLQRQVAAAGLRSPTLIVIGEVVALAPDWPRAKQHVAVEGGLPASTRVGALVS